VKYLRTWWLVVLGLVVLPWVVLFAAGSIWFWEKGYLWYYLGISGACTIAERTARSARLRKLVLPDASWTPLPDFE